MPRHNNTYEYDNKTFSSIKALSNYVGMNEKTVTARLRRGLSIEKACDPKLLNKRYSMYDGVEKSITQICREQDKDIDLVNNRLKRNYGLNEALNKPKKITRQGSPIIVNGILYKSIAAAARKQKLSHKESTIRSRLKAGWDNDRAFCFDNK